MSKIGGKPTVSKHPRRNLVCFPPIPTLASFVDALKEQYYPVGSYYDQYTKWTTLWQERDQAVPEFNDVFHTLHTKLGIKDSEWHLALKYSGCLHKYIQTEMEFLDISSLGIAYWYAVKIEQKFIQQLDMWMHHRKRWEEAVSPHIANGW